VDPAYDPYVIGALSSEGFRNMHAQLQHTFAQSTAPRC
jgi:hypothetical protein